MQIKVTDTKMLKIITTYYNSGDCDLGIKQYTTQESEVPVVEGKLVLIKNENIYPEIDQIGFNISVGNLFWNQVTPSKQIEKLVGVVTPIIISETERIEMDDWVQLLDYFGNPFLGGPQQWKGNGVLNNGHVKVLALPEHFSPKHLRDIVDGKMKDGDKLLVECETKYDDTDTFINEWGNREGRDNEFVRFDSQGHIILYRPKEKVYTI